MTAESLNLDQLIRENSQLKIENNYLKEQLDWLKRQLFGKRSERTATSLDVQFLPGFEPTSSNAEPEKQAITGHERRKLKRTGKDAISLPDDLPVVREIIDLPEEEKTCSESGQQLVKIGEEATRKLAYRPGSYFVKELVRFKYALPKESEGGIRIAPLPETLLVRCHADESLLADILTKKFADHLPLYRLSEIFARQGIGISRQTLCQWVSRCAQALKPLHQEMNRQILTSENLFMDESPLDMQAPGKGKVHQAFMWVMVGGKQSNPAYRVYHFRPDRKHENAAKLLEGYKGVLHSDKYGAYESLAIKKSIIWSPCWTHIRRKFIEAEGGDPPFRKWVLRKIRYLFMLERVAWERTEEERLSIRRDKELPIIEELIQAVKKRLCEGKILPKSKFKEALGYFIGLIPHLKNYCYHPYARLDNNVAERAIRPLALGRKNWLFVGNEEGGEAAAIILSLVQTCRGLNINPFEYLHDVMRRLMSHNSQRLHELLPDQWAASKQQP